MSFMCLLNEDCAMINLLNEENTDKVGNERIKAIANGQACLVCSITTCDNPANRPKNLNSISLLK